MNRLFYVLILGIFFTNCQEEDYPEICIDDVCIQGEWEWVESYGSIAGTTITPMTENETRKLIITETKYQEYVDNILIVDKEYEYVKSDELSTFTEDSLILKLVGSNWYAVFGENENLILREPCADCWEHTYKRY